MKKWLSNLNTGYKTAVFSSLVLGVIYLAIIFFYFLNLPEFPNGFLLGSLVGILVYILLGLSEVVDAKKKKVTFGIIVTILRFLLIGGALFLSAYLYYEKNAPIFNVFTVLGGYMSSLIIYIIVMIREKKDA